MDTLPTLWFVLIGVLWAGYLLLEGFDLGVGMHLLLTGRDDTRRRVMLNTIGPVWDGNEVWLVTAGAATFAAFPLWYASLLSTMYLPVTVLLLALIFRAVGIEYRGKGTTARWRRTWDLAVAVGSFAAAFGVGALLGTTTIGLPLDVNGDRVGGPFAGVGWGALLGGTAVVGFCLVHAAVFLALKTHGSVRDTARRFVLRWGPALLVPLVVWISVVVGIAVTDGRVGSAAGIVLLATAAVAASTALLATRAGRDGLAFLGLCAFLLAGVAALFASVFPVVLPSSLDPRWSLTVANASSGDYTLGVMSVVALVGLPIVLLYQGWTYWVFRRRITEAHIPAAHPFRPAIRTTGRP